MSLMQILGITVIVLSILNMFRMGLYLIGSDIYAIKLMRSKKQRKTRFTPYVTVIVPAHNEEAIIEDCLNSIVANKYPNSRLSIVVANDGSTDKTRSIVQRYIRNNTSNITIKLMNQKNKGKAAALNNAIKRHVKTPYFMCLDADSLLHEDAIYCGVQQFTDKRVVAVAANVNIIEDGTMLGLLQRFEYLISYNMKKAQVLYNIEYITGGIGSLFRRTAVVDVGYYDTNTMTEDIDLSMKFVVKGNKENRLAYAADCIAYTESVHNIKSLITQRFRWKYGRMQTFLKNKKAFFNTDAPYARQLTLLMLPFALVQEFLFLIEPIVVGYIMFIILGQQDWITFVSAFGVIMAYLMFNVWSSDNLTVKERMRLTYFAPPMYIAMYALSFVEYIALLKAMVKLPNLKKSMAAKHVTWSSPERQAKAGA